MRKGLLFTLFFLGRISLLAATEIDDALDYLAEKELVVSLATRIVESEHQTVWHMENTKITLSGQAVNLKMTGENLVVFAQITPYIQDDETILLVAKGEVFVSSAEEGTKYYSTLKSLPISLGEKVFFFPLGMAVDSQHNLYYIELEIQVLHMPGEEDEPSAIESGDSSATKWPEESVADPDVTELP